MMSKSMVTDTPRWREREVRGGLPKNNASQSLAALHEEVYQQDITDRERLYGDSLYCEWCRQSNLSPDDFE